MTKLIFDLQRFARGATATSGIADRRRNLDVSKKIMLYEPDASQFTVMLMRMHKGTATSTRFFWYDKEKNGFWTKINKVGGYAADAVSLVLDDVSQIGKDVIIKNGRTGEPMLVTAYDDAAKTVTVTRGFGTTAAAAINDDDPIEIISPAFKEGDYAPDAISTQPTEYENVTQIIRTSVDVTRSQEDEAKTAGGSEQTRQLQEKMIDHRKFIERSILRGEYKNDTTNNRRAMKGLVSFAENTYDADGTLTEYKLDEIAEMAWTYTDAAELTWVCSGRVITVVNRFANARIFINDMATKKYGLDVRTIQTSHGKLNLVESKAFEQSYAYEGIICNMEDLEYLPYTNADTKLIKNIESPATGYDGYKHEYKTECSIRVRKPKVLTRTINIQQ
jgi:hypothetical protein